MPMYHGVFCISITSILLHTYHFSLPDKNSELSDYWVKCFSNLITNFRTDPIPHRKLVTIVKQKVKRGTVVYLSWGLPVDNSAIFFTITFNFYQEFLTTKLDLLSIRGFVSIFTVVQLFCCLGLSIASKAQMLSKYQESIICLAFRSKWTSHMSKVRTTLHGVGFAVSEERDWN